MINMDKIELRILLFIIALGIAAIGITIGFFINSNIGRWIIIAGGFIPLFIGLLILEILFWKKYFEK